MPPAKSVEWGTPQEFFDELNREFDFTLDPCASHENAKCERYFTKDEDGLAQSWAGERVFMNPPYGNQASNWIAKAYFESQYAEVVVALLPARTDTRWFHDFVYGKAEIRFVKGRLKFVAPDGKTGIINQIFRRHVHGDEEFYVHIIIPQRVLEGNHGHSITDDEKSKGVEQKK